MTYINIYDMDNNALSHHNNQLANKLIIDTLLTLVITTYHSQRGQM